MGGSGATEIPNYTTPCVPRRDVGGRSFPKPASSHIDDAVAIHGESPQPRALLARATRFLTRSIEAISGVYASWRDLGKCSLELDTKLPRSKSLATVPFENPMTLLKDIHRISLLNHDATIRLHLPSSMNLWSPTRTQELRSSEPGLMCQVRSLVQSVNPGR